MPLAIGTILECSGYVPAILFLPFFFLHLICISNVLQWNLKLLMSGVDMLHLDTFRLVQYEKRQGQIRQEKQKFLQKRVRICIQCHTIPIILHVYVYMHSICTYEFTNIQLYEITYWTSGSGLHCEVAIILIQYGNLQDWKIVVLLPRWPLSWVLLCINMLKRVYVLVLCI